MMNPNERKAAFRQQVDLDGKTLSGAAQEICGVTWFHLSEGLKDSAKRPLSDEVKAKFAAYIGRSVYAVFGRKAA